MLSWSSRILLLGLVGGMGWILLNPPPILKAKMQPKSTRITVYQQQGKQGEASFSDHPDHGKPRDVDTRNSTTFSSQYSQSVNGQVPNSASASYNSPATTDPMLTLKQQNEKFAQQAADMRRAQVDRVVDR